MSANYMPFAGDMRERVTVQKEIDRPDGAGGARVGWAPEKTVWAKVAALSSTTRIQAREQAMAITHRVTMRYIDYLALPSTARYRLVWKGQEMKISGVTNPDGVRRYIDIECELGQMVAA